MLKKEIMPKENEKDLEEIPEEIKKELTFKFAERIEDVLDVAFYDTNWIKEKATKKKAN